MDKLNRKQFVYKCKPEYHVFPGNNKYSRYKYTEDQAKAAYATLTNCQNCTNCENCTNCTDCVNCSNCTNCTKQQNLHNENNIGHQVCCDEPEL